MDSDFAELRSRIDRPEAALHSRKSDLLFLFPVDIDLELIVDQFTVRQIGVRDFQRIIRALLDRRTEQLLLFFGVQEVVLKRAKLVQFCFGAAATSVGPQERVHRKVDRVTDELAFVVQTVDQQGARRRHLTFQLNGEGADRVLHNEATGTNEYVLCDQQVVEHLRVEIGANMKYCVLSDLRLAAAGPHLYEPSAARHIGKEHQLGVDRFLQMTLVLALAFAVVQEVVLVEKQVRCPDQVTRLEVLVQICSVLV